MTKIEWCEEVWNPVTGCTKIASGCKNCYAEAIAKRFWKGRPFSDVQCHPERLNQPLRWKKPRRIFVNSMSDLFHERVPFDFIDRVFAVMALCPQHTFICLTKRGGNMRTWACEHIGGVVQGGCVDLFRLVPPMPYLSDAQADLHRRCHLWPLPNVWLGVSASTQRDLDALVPDLLATPAAVRVLSLEPLLGPVEIQTPGPYRQHKGRGYLENIGRAGRLIQRGIDWVIVGGESGPGARPCNVAWIRSVVEQCKAAGVACFVKQDCGPRPGMRGRIPDDLWLKEFPDVK